MQQPATRTGSKCIFSYVCCVGVCGSVRAWVYVCVVQFASNKPFTMRARSVNATLYSPGLVCVSLLCVCVCCVLYAVRCLLLGVAVTQPLTTIPYPVFRCRCLCLCYFQSRCIPVARASWLCQLWFIYRWNYLVLRFDASHCQSNFILHSKPFCTLHAARS